MRAPLKCYKKPAKIGALIIPLSGGSAFGIRISFGSSDFGTRIFAGWAASDFHLTSRDL
jgi:hypothetical protein